MAREFDKNNFSLRCFAVIEIPRAEYHTTPNDMSIRIFAVDDVHRYHRQQNENNECQHRQNAEKLNRKYERKNVQEKQKNVHLLWKASFHVPGIENLRVREVRISLLFSSSLCILHH
ncbi:hypothetical protein LJH38_004485 [Salmonella enterica]|nr:hypothetical protein [Salmonella enterica]ELU4002659.1 hypothetical protein [Salmonella enterica]